MNDTAPGERLLKSIEDGVFDEFPFPIYCTTLEGGVFKYVNQAFELKFNCKIENLKHPGCTAASLYANGDVRHDWRRMLARGGAAVYHTEFQQPWSDSEVQRFFVLDCAKLYRLNQQDDVVFGMLVDVTKYAVPWQRDRQRLRVLKQILDLPAIGIGVHQIDKEGRLLWMNDEERRLVNVDREWLKSTPNVSKLAATDLDARACRVRRKIRGINPLTKGQHRTFVDQRDGKPIPVNIHDFGIKSIRGGGDKYAEIYTVVRNEQISPEVKSILERFGPDNPLLEEAGIRTFIKVKRRFAEEHSPSAQRSSDESASTLDELVFIQGNALFVEELQELANQRRTEIRIKSSSDLHGLTDAQLFPDYAGAYSTPDEAVMATGLPDERIEKHPAPLGRASIDVQVLKLPFFREPHQTPIGIQCFYWPALERGDRRRDSVQPKKVSVAEKLKELHDAWHILDDAPVAIFRKVRKDGKHRFTYANQMFLQQVRSGIKDSKKRAQFSTVDKIIGKAYGDIFDSEWPNKYEADDNLILDGQETLHKREGLIGDNVAVIIKTPIARPDGAVVGVQGVLYELTDFGVPRKRVSVDLGKRKLHIVGEDAINLGAGGDEWLLFNLLCRNLDNAAPVSYDEIQAYLHGGPLPNTAASKVAVADNVHKVYQRLMGRIKDHKDLKARVKIKNHRKIGYKMTFT